MNKADLQARWGQYCDTNKLVDDMMKLFRVNGHRNGEHGVCTMLNTYFTSKEPLIQKLATSNHYIGNMRIALKKSFERKISMGEISGFFNNTRDAFGPASVLKYVDEENKTMHDHMRTGKSCFKISELSDNAALKGIQEKLANFDMDTGATMESTNLSNAYREYYNMFNRTASAMLPRDFEASYGRKGPKLRAGTKTSRAFNTVCHYFGIDKREDYNKLFARYADLVSELSRQMYFIISLNPLDYLTMSFGVSWNSCHRINGGGWQGGCLSYMLDETSMITYVIDNMDEEIHNIPKYYRQMFHYDGEMFLQNRLYPQGNDGATDLYSKFRSFVIEEFNELLENDEEWNVETGYSVCTIHTESDGAHYRDYVSNRSCNIFYPRSKRNLIANRRMHIGHTGICPCCGEEYTYSNNISHPSCTRR